MDLSVIVPAYKEGKHIYSNLLTLKDSLDKLNRSYEIVVVADGNKDNTYQEAVKLASDTIKVYSYEKNKGKGYALKYGVERAKGQLITFIDADLDLHPKEIDTFMKLMDTHQADVVIGSKRHPESKVNYPLFRRLQSFIYQMLIGLLFNINVRDTQTGLKLFKREVLQRVLPRALVKRYAFDLELLVIAHRLGYANIIEAPVELKYQFSSTVNLRAAWKTFWDTLAIFYRLRFLKYYDRADIHTEVADKEERVLEH